MDINKDKVNVNCFHIVKDNFKVSSKNRVLIFFDEEIELTKALKEGYEHACDELKISFESLNFYDFKEEDIKSKVDELNEEDLVILVQSSSFRMSKYRWRNLLFELNLKVVEHAQLNNNKPEEYNNYIESLNYDLDHYKIVSKFLMDKIKNANNIKLVSSSGKVLEYSGPMDEAFDNIGSFEDKKNWGTRFPIGEVLTESLDLSTLNGEFEVYAFPGTNIRTNFCEKFTGVVKDGLLVSHNGPSEFNEVYELVKTENPEGDCYIRELGLGLNRSIKRDTYLSDVSSYERLEGMHISLGMKHGIYRKKLWPKYGKKFNQRFHIDVFVDVSEMLIDDEVVYRYEKGYLCY